MNDRSAVVFLHAFPLRGSMWSAQLAALSGRTVLHPDFPGFGQQPPGEPSLDRFADVVLAAMDVAGLRQATIVGLSMGGYVACRLVDRAPERIAALVLADTRSGRDDEATRKKRTDQARRVREEGLHWLPEALLPALLGETTRRTRPEVVSHVRASIASADPEGVARALEAMRERPDSTPLLANIAVPVLVLVGEEDTLTPPAEAQGIVDAVGDGRLVVIPGAGHLSNLENPEAFNEALVTFLGES